VTGTEIRQRTFDEGTLPVAVQTKPKQAKPQKYSFAPKP